MRELWVLVGAVSLCFPALGCLPPTVMNSEQVLADSQALAPAVPSFGVGRIIGEDRTFEVHVASVTPVGPRYQSSGPVQVTPLSGAQVDFGMRLSRVLLSIGGVAMFVGRDTAGPMTQSPQGVPFDLAARLMGQTFGRDDWDLGWELDLYAQDGIFHFPAFTTVDPTTGSNVMVPAMSGDAFAIQLGGGVTPEVRVGHVRLLAGLYARTFESGDRREFHFFFPPSDSPGRALVGTGRIGVEVPFGHAERFSLLVDAYGSAGWPDVPQTGGGRLGLISRF